MSRSPRSRLVARPLAHLGAGRPPIYPIADLLKTVNTKWAVKVPFGARRPNTVVSSLKRLAERRGYRLRHQRRVGHVLAWLEKREPA